MADLTAARKFADGIIAGCDTARSNGFKLSAPSEGYLNLAKAFLEVSSPICCQAEIRCDNCPMKHWEIAKTSWLNPLSKPAAAKKERKKRSGAVNVTGRKGMPVTLNGRSFPSIAEAARQKGVHKAVINRMLRDEALKEGRQ